MSERNFSERDDFGSYELWDEKAESILVSPFVVVVMGLHNQVLGTGRLIGQVAHVIPKNPIIELTDPAAPGETIQVLGTECWWAPLGDSAERLAERLAARPEAIMPASVYIESLES